MAEATRWKQAILSPTGLTGLTVLAITVGIGLRLALAYFFRGNFDQISYELVAAIMERGGNVYAETTRYNYSPVWAHILLALHRIATWSQLPFHFIIRTFLTLIDLLNAILIGSLCARSHTMPARLGFSLYLLNPVAIILVGFHGQFETLAILPLLFATSIASAPTLSPSRQLAIWSLGAMALIVKHLTVFSVWMLFYCVTTKRRAVIWFLLALLAFLVTFLPYLPAGADGIARNVLTYTGSGMWALSFMLPWQLAAIIFVVGMVCLPALARDYLRLGPARSMELAAVALLALIFVIAQQYLLVPIIFGTIFASRWYWVYTLLGVIALAGSRYGFHLPYLPELWGAVWLGLVGWLSSYFVTWKKPLPT